MTHGDVDAWAMTDALKSLGALDGDPAAHVATDGAEMNEVWADRDNFRSRPATAGSYTGCRCLPISGTDSGRSSLTLLHGRARCVRTLRAVVPLARTRREREKARACAASDSRGRRTGRNAAGGCRE